MPRVVDHEARRAEIVNALLTIASSRGLHAATSRAIAHELQVATGALWHYFPNFNAVLGAAFAEVFARTNRRIDDQTTGLTGMRAIRAMMREVLPTSAVTMTEAQLVVGYWGRVAIDDALASHQLDLEREWRERLTGYLDQAVSDGELITSTPVADVVDLLMSITSGQQVEAVLKPELPTITSKSELLLDICLRPWRAS